MSSNFEKFNDGQDNPEDIEPLLKELLQTKFDEELKQELQKDLKDQYGVSKENKSTTLGRRKLTYILTAIAAGFGLLIMTTYFFNTKKSKLASEDPPSLSSFENAEKLAINYLKTTDIYHGGAVKGTTSSQSRTQAINAFNAKNYEQAAQYFSLIEAMTEEDLFYCGVASLYNENYGKSIKTLQQVSDMGTQYSIEADWYLALAHILNGNRDAAKPTFGKRKIIKLEQGRCKPSSERTREKLVLVFIYS